MNPMMFSEAFSLWGSPVTWLEIAAFAVSLAMVACNIRVIHWGWPLAMVASVLYGLLFWHYKLYGEAGLQVLFVVLAGWGWWAWLRPPASSPTVAPHGMRSSVGITAKPIDASMANSPASIRNMPDSLRIKVAGASVALCAATGLFLSRATDSDVPWADGVPTALSVTGQVLLGGKYVENWLVWLVVNVLSTALFAYKGLYLTALLYAIFAALSWVGWAAWQRLPRAGEQLR
jgi:nicotinamide mononucleotide transporter